MSLTKIEIITRPNKLDDLKIVLDAIGIAGMTVSQVYGFGMTKGHTEVYRGKVYSINLLPKVKVEIVVCDDNVQKIIESARMVLNTGNLGDGKIFVTKIENAVRIRTGETGIDAIIQSKT